MKILISGATGFIGSKLVSRLRSSGHTVTLLVRSTSDVGLLWDPYRHEVDLRRMEGYDVFVNLSGESINGRWTNDKKKKIADSRIYPTRFLSECIGKLKNPPKSFVCASAIGYYGNRGDEELTENSGPGSGFLADVCKAWESETRMIESKGIRVVNVRTGLVLSPEGGALQKLLLPFKLGVGGVVGSGRQWWSWIDLNDLLRIYQYAIENDSVQGPVNAVAPNTVTNKIFVKSLARVLRRPALFPLPSFIVKIIFGEMGEELLLFGQRVLPARLNESGFEFEHKELEPALRSML
ncbi:MAG: TIGR01777 family oxidoreductase [Bacteroidota bacterium]|nr:TIGR01777 family oxidoreductase [Bacteroidota bacterium]